MRALVILVFAAFSFGAMATLERSGTVPEASGAKVGNIPAGNLSGAVDTVRTIRSHLRLEKEAGAQSSPRHQGSSRLAVGEVLPDGTALFVVPGHESYRHAIV